MPFKISLLSGRWLSWVHPALDSFGNSYLSCHDAHTRFFSNQTHLGLGILIINLYEGLGTQIKQNKSVSAPNYKADNLNMNTNHIQQKIYSIHTNYNLGLVPLADSSQHVHYSCGIYTCHYFVINHFVFNICCITV